MANAIAGVKRVIAVASGKGGVGKSTTAMNLAVALGLKGLKVGVLDADVYGPSQPRMLGVKDAKPESDGQWIEPVVAHGIKVMSMGFLVDEATPTVWRGPMVQSALTQMLRQVRWGTEEDPLDVLVLDMPPGTGDTQLSITQNVALAGAVIVSTPQDIALIDARKGLEMFRKVNVDVLGVVENMSVFCCPNCGEETHIFGAHGAKAMADELGYEVLAEVPLELEVREFSDAGKPMVVASPDGKAAAVYRTLADRVWDKISVPSSDATGPVKIVIE